MQDDVRTLLQLSTLHGMGSLFQEARIEQVLLSLYAGHSDFDSCPEWEGDGAGCNAIRGSFVGRSPPDLSEVESGGFVTLR